MRPCVIVARVLNRARGARFSVPLPGSAGSRDWFWEGDGELKFAAAR